MVRFGGAQEIPEALVPPTVKAPKFPPDIRSIIGIARQSGNSPVAPTL
jgi:hypothetical protein